jgi:site-specific recombinase XerD
MSHLRSGFSGLIEKFIVFRKASGSWNEPNYGLNIKLFDHFCADNYPANMVLTQEMVDAWCAKRDTEAARSHDTRTRVVRTFIDYLRRRNLTDVMPPLKLKPESSTYIPYAFEEDELKRFFHACDSIQPYHIKKTASTIRKYTIPVFFRLLYSTGMRTTEARLIKRGDVDLVHGVIDIQKSKGYDQHYVAMHDTMTDLMAKYDHAISELQPSRNYFFQSSKTGVHYSRDWVQDNFRALWNEANGTFASPVRFEEESQWADP